MNDNNLGFVYLCQPEEYKNMNVYKIGNTVDIKQRISSYGKNTNLLLSYKVKNKIYCEKLIIKKFNEYFKLFKGKEWFKGELDEIKNIFNTTITDDLKYNENDNTYKDICKFCNKTFSTKSNCVKHEKICETKNNTKLDSIESVKNEIKKIDEHLNQKDEQIKKIDEQIKQKDEQIKQKDEQLKQKYEQIKQKDEQLKQKDEFIELLKSIIYKYVNKPTITYNIIDDEIDNENDTKNNNVTTLKDTVSKLDPIDFQDIKKYIDKYNSEYIDKGEQGFLKFLYNYPFKDKFITSDFSRNTIAYKTKDVEFIRDPKGINLIKYSIKENIDDIIEKINQRLEFINNEITSCQDKYEVKKLINIKFKINKFIDKIKIL